MVSSSSVEDVVLVSEVVSGASVDEDEDEVELDELVSPVSEANEDEEVDELVVDDEEEEEEEELERSPVFQMMKCQIQ